jgi:transposase-like protein
LAKRLTDQKKKKIIADYIENQNIRETSRINKVSTDTVRRLIAQNKDIARKLTQKKEENMLTTLEYMEKQHEAKKRIMDKILKGIEQKADNIDMFTNIKDLATAYGIIVDKELKSTELKQSKMDFTEINKGIQNIANLINNPVKERKEDEIDG